ncbi:MAG: hypothetical protein IKS16_08915 [Lachnospiraceae bacterium]|nr:hypothetical protein [Lachnospiraceae bacterium]
MQNVTMLGIKLQDRSVEESLGCTSRFLRSSALDVIAYIDYEVIRHAVFDAGIRDLLRSAAVTEWSDSYLLEAVGAYDPERAVQIDSREFLRDELAGMAAGDKTIALAADSDEAIDRLESQLEVISPGLNIVHRQVIHTGDGASLEDELNDINRVAPAMIISHMNYHDLSEWLGGASSMINVGIWLALPDTMPISINRDKGVMTGLCDFFRSRFLKIRLDRYKEV